MNIFKYLENKFHIDLKKQDSSGKWNFSDEHKMRGLKVKSFSK